MAMIETECLRRFLSYDPGIGSLTWNERELSDCVSKGECQRWNKRFAGKRAGTVKPGRYRDLVINDQTFRASRIIWQLVTGHEPDGVMDHWNGDKTDDRWANLRVADLTQNAGNQKVHKDNGGGLKGATFNKKAGRWQAQIQSSKSPKKYLGLFDTPEEAHAAYMAAARKAYGEFARAG